MALGTIRATRVFDVPKRTLCKRCGIEIEPKNARPGLHCRDCYQALKPISVKLERRLAKLRDGWEDLAAS